MTQPGPQLSCACMMNLIKMNYFTYSKILTRVPEIYLNKGRGLCQSSNRLPFTPYSSPGYIVHCSLYYAHTFSSDSQV